MCALKPLLALVTVCCREVVASCTVKAADYVLSVTLPSCQNFVLNKIKRSLWCGASHPKLSCLVTEQIPPGERTRHFAQVAALETPRPCVFKSLKWR